MEIDLDALTHNYRCLRANLGPATHIIPALKGNAYGHGIAMVVSRLAELDIHSLAVGSAIDAHTARQGAPSTPILTFGGPLPEGLPALLEHGFTPTVYNLALAQAVSDWARRPTDVYVKVDAGLGRLGVPVNDALRFITRIATLDNLRIAGLYTHLTFFDATQMEWARQRIGEFDNLLARLESAGLKIPITQALASTAILTGLTSRANTVCPGSLLFGICPVDPELCDFSAFRPVLKSIKSQLIHVRSSPDKVGVVPVGVADGFRRFGANAKPEALLRGQRIPIRGVSLEYTNVDLTHVDNAAVGDEVVLVGPSGEDHITLDDLGTWWGTSPLHALMSFGGHVHRVAVT
jgi:alanine racemase